MSGCRPALAALLLVGAGAVKPTIATANPGLVAQIDGLEAEHQSLLAPTATTTATASHWTPPVFDADNILISWRVQVPAARNVTQVSAVVTLTTAGRPPIVCEETSSNLSLFCGSAGQWSTHAARYSVTLDVVLRTSTTATATTTTHATAQGWLMRGLQRGGGSGLGGGWGGAEWIGLPDANDTAAQYRSVSNIHALGFTQSSDVAQATLFVSGLGGYRATVNGRPLDPTSVRGSITEWSNRTFYFGDDVTADLRLAAADPDGLVAIAVELYKHWYGLANRFYPVPYGPRSLKAVLMLTHANGTNVFVAPTCSATASGCGWRHGSGSTLHEDLHTGQSGDGRLATPGWESAHYDASGPAWAVPAAVAGPPGELRPFPMQRSRVLEVARPISVARVTGDPNSGPGVTYRFTLPHEVAGFCTALLPRGSPAGMTATLRHGEAVDMGTGLLVDVECTGSLAPNHGLHCNHMAYIARGDASGMSAHDRSWRQLALHGNISSGGIDDDPEGLEAFTPAFQFSAFRFIEVSYNGTVSPFPAPDVSSMACYRVGAGFDWTGDVMVAPPPGAADDTRAATGSVQHSIHSDEGTTTTTSAAERFNTVVAATRSTAISNYLMDVPTDCPHREKRGWTGDSLAAHSAVSSFFDMRAAWTKWVDDILYTQSMLDPAGTVPQIVPCVFYTRCRNDPRYPGRKPAETFADVAWGSILPLLGSYTAKLTADARLASRATVGAAAYVALLHLHSNNASTSDYPGLLNTTNWKGHLGDWVPAEGKSAVSTLLNSHHMILDADAAVALLKWTSTKEEKVSVDMNDGVTATAVTVEARERSGPSEAELTQWAATARASFAKAFLHNVTVPGTQPPQTVTCGSVQEKQPIVLSCGASGNIAKVVFAGYGVPNGTCAAGLYPNSECYLDVSSQVSAACLGRSTCSVECDVIPHMRICAGVNVSDPCGGVAKHLSVSVSCSEAPIPPAPAPDGPIIGLAFRDPYRPTPARGPPVQTEAASGMAAMDSAPTSVIDETQRVALGDMLAALVVNHNSSSPQAATVTGGVIDMSHLAPELINHGHPDVAFSLLAADGYPSYYNMARYGGTLWENWANANGCDTPAGCDNKNVQTSGKGVGSLNHIMYGGSVGSAVFGIGGIQPFAPAATGIGRAGVAPIPWLLDAPRGAAVWRSRAGAISAAWAATLGDGIVETGPEWGGRWHVWVNVTVPAGSSGGEIQVMLPQTTHPSAVCAWECGLAGGGASAGTTAPFISEWVSFDAGGGHQQYRVAVPPPSAGAAPAPDRLANSCAPIWQAGTASKPPVAGIESVNWAAARPGHTKFPALSLATTSGAYAVFAQAC